MARLVRHTRARGEVGEDDHERDTRSGEERNAGGTQLTSDLRVYSGRTKEAWKIQSKLDSKHAENAGGNRIATTEENEPLSE